MVTDSLENLEHYVSLHPRFPRAFAYLRGLLASGAPDGKHPNTERRSYAQLTPDEKDAISHRGNALAEMEKELPEFLAEN